MIEDDLVLGPGDVGPLLRVAKSRLFREAVWRRVATAFGLTKLEMDVAILLALGHDSGKIAGELEMTSGSVASYLRILRVKLQIPVEPGRRQSSHRVVAKLLLTAVGYLDHGLPGESDVE